MARIKAARKWLVMALLMLAVVICWLMAAAAGNDSEPQEPAPGQTQWVTPWYGTR